MSGLIRAAAADDEMAAAAAAAADEAAATAAAETEDEAGDPDDEPDDPPPLELPPLLLPPELGVSCDALEEAFVDPPRESLEPGVDLRWVRSFSSLLHLARRLENQTWIDSSIEQSYCIIIAYQDTIVC